MAEKHDLLESRYRTRLSRAGYKISKKHPFVGYRPDIYATKDKEKVVVEVEIETTIHTDHTRSQLLKMYKFIKSNKNHFGFLVVPKKAKPQSEFLVNILCDRNKINVVGL